MPLHGAVDFASPRAVGGWVSAAGTETPPVVEAVLAGTVIGSGVADLDRTDLKAGCRGFKVSLAQECALSDFSTGRLVVIAQQGDAREALKIWRVIEVAGKLEETANGPLSPAIRLLAAPHRRAIADAFARFYGGDAAGTAGREPIDPGGVSDDEAAVTGQNGHLFLYQGSNRVVDLYEARRAPLDLVRAWAALYGKRVARLNSLGLHYLQIMIPEKSSIMPHLVPFTVEGPSALWREVMQAMKEVPAGSDTLFDAYAVLRDGAVPEGTFCQRDSHLSSYGCRLIVENVVRGCLGNVPYRLTGTAWEDRIGDLGRRFQGADQQAAERVRLFAGLTTLAGGALEPKQIESFDPPDGHQQSRRVWICENAPIQRRALCFGNSFFERGRTSTHLSWWFARLFREFHFVWSADIDWDSVQRVRPDLVIGQSIERFLRRCPRD